MDWAKTTPRPDDSDEKHLSLEIFCVDIRGFMVTPI